MRLRGSLSLSRASSPAAAAVSAARLELPLALGQLNGSWIVASETCAFDLLGATYVRDIEPGEMVRISRAGIESLHFAPEKPLQQCIFEHVYFSRPEPDTG